MRTAFEAEGDIRGTDLLAGLVNIWRTGGTGSLHFSRPGATAGLDFDAGDIVGVSSSDSRFEAAAILLRAGKLDQSTVERLATPETGDRALTAMKAGVLTRREWRWGEKIRAVEVLSDLLTWLEGEYLYDETSRPVAGEFRLTVPRLVLELFLRSRDRGLVLHYLGGSDVPLACSASFETEFPTFGLTADAESVVRLIDGKSTAAEISAEAPAESFAVEKLLAALVTLGLVHPEFAAEVETPRSAAAGPARPSNESDGEEPPGPEAVEAATVEGLDLEREPESAGDFEEPQSPEPATEVPRPYEPEPEAEPAELRLRETEYDEQGTSAVDFEAEESLAGDMTDVQSEESYRRASFDAPIDSSEDRDPDRARGRGSAAPFLWLIVLLAAGVAAIILFRAFGRPPRGAAIPARTATVSPAPAVATAAVPSAVRTSEALGKVTPAPTQPSRPTPARPAAEPTRAIAPSPARVPGREAAREDSRAYWLDRAARDRKRADADRRSRFAIQLELACETGSLVEAWKHDRPAGTMWVLATPFQGRTCFRVLWGRYPSREAARRALAGIPAFFTTPRNRPIAAAIR